MIARKLCHQFIRPIVLPECNCKQQIDFLVQSSQKKRRRKTSARKRTFRQQINHMFNQVVASRCCQQQQQCMLQRMQPEHVAKGKRKTTSMWWKWWYVCLEKGCTVRHEGKRDFSFQFSNIFLLFHVPGKATELVRSRRWNLLPQIKKTKQNIGDNVSEI